MAPVSPLPAIVALFFGVLSSCLIVKHFGAPPTQGRYATIDGMRGYLAYFVFLHHSCQWYFYLRTGHWEPPPSNLYNHFAHSSVALFFMITGFLFYSKIINGKTKGINWLRLYISRFLRLVPLYLFAISMLFLIVFLLSDGSLKESPGRLIKGGIRWLSFTILGAPDLNGITDTWTIIAGVTWTLPYEWFFYFSLPLIAWVSRAYPSAAALLFGTLFVILSLYEWRPSFNHLFAFAGGMIASILVRFRAFRRFAVSLKASILVLCIIAVLIISIEAGYHIVPLLLLTFIFSIIAGGNSLFGSLTTPASRTLGEMSYSIYLLHGILLTVFFKLIIGESNAKEFSALAHWGAIILVSPLIILFAYCSFRLIERPFMKKTNAVTSKLSSMLFPNYRCFENPERRSCARF